MGVALVLLGALALATGCAPAVRSTPVVAAPPSATLETAIHDLVNEYRRGRKLPALMLDPQISDVARRHSAAMAAGKMPFGHGGFGERVATLGDGGPSRVAENVAYDPDHARPAREILQGWLRSRAHRENIEGPYDRTGIGAARNALGDVYLTQIFVGSPQGQRSR